MTGRRPDPDALSPNLGATLHDVARAMRRRFERHARKRGLPITRQQARTLLFIARNEGLSQATVATRLEIEPIALVRLLDRLHEEGLVERRAHPTDRRVRTLWLTPPAWAVIDRGLEINRAVREEAWAGIPEPDRMLVMQVLARMKDNLDLADEMASAAAE